MDDDDARASSTAATIRRIGDCSQDHDSDGSSSTCSCPPNLHWWCYINVLWLGLPTCWCCCFLAFSSATPCTTSTHVRRRRIKVDGLYSTNILFTRKTISGHPNNNNNNRRLGCRVFEKSISWIYLLLGSLSQLPLGWGTGGPTVVTRHRSIEICRDNTTNNNHIFGEIRPESDVKTRPEDLI